MLSNRRTLLCINNSNHSNNGTTNSINFKRGNLSNNNSKCRSSKIISNPCIVNPPACTKMWTDYHSR